MELKFMRNPCLMILGLLASIFAGCASEISHSVSAPYDNNEGEKGKPSVWIGKSINGRRDGIWIDVAENRRGLDAGLMERMATFTDDQLNGSAANGIMRLEFRDGKLDGISSLSTSNLDVEGLGLRNTISIVMTFKEDILIDGYLAIDPYPRVHLGTIGSSTIRFKCKTLNGLSNNCSANALFLLKNSEGLPNVMTKCDSRTALGRGIELRSAQEVLDLARKCYGFSQNFVEMIESGV